MSNLPVVRVLAAVCMLQASSYATPFLHQYASAKSVRDIIPDGDYLWLATSNGLYRAQIVNRDTSDTADTSHYSLPTDFGDIDLAAMVKTSDGNLWIGTRNGYVVSMDPGAERFESFNSLSYAGWTISCMTAYKDYLLIGSQNGMSVFSRTKGAVVYNAKKFGDFESSRVSAIETYGDTIAVVLEGGVVWIAPDNITDVNLNDPSVWATIDTAGIQGVVVDRSGLHLYTSRVQRSGGSLFEIAYDGGTTTVHRNGALLATIGGFVNRVVEHGNAVYLGMDNDFLYRLFPDGTNEQIVLNSLTRTDTRASVVDAHGVLWCVHDVVNRNMGAGITRRTNGVWTSLVYQSESDPGFGTMGFGKGEEMNCLLLSTNGDVWVGTFGVGLKWYDRSENVWRHFEDSSTAANFGMPHTPSPIARFNPDPGNYWTFISALCEDSTGAVWIGNERAHNGLEIHAFDPDAARWRSFGKDQHGLPAGYVRALESAYHNGVHYVYAGYVESEGGGGEGLTQFRFSGDPIDGTVSTASAPLQVRSVVNDIAIVGDSLLYLATNTGLLRMRNHDFGTTTALELVRPSGPIYSVCVSPGGHPVFSMNGDLYEYHDSAGYSYDSLLNLTKSGLLGTEVYDIHYDKANAAYWLSTGQGLFRFETGEYGVASAADYGDIQVYPNPLSLSKGADKVYFDKLAPQSRVLLYDMAGNLLWQSDGDHEHGRTGQVVYWDGRNQSGRQVGPGTYYYYVFSDNKRRAGKLLVVP